MDGDYIFSFPKGYLRQNLYDSRSIPDRFNICILPKLLLKAIFPSTSSISPKMALINDDFPDPTVPTTATKLFSWIKKEEVCQIWLALI